MTSTPDVMPEDPPHRPGQSQTSTYDAIPYSVNAFAQTTPNRLAVVAALFGLTPAAPDRCRVLELGCAAGGNIIPMALIHPNSHFVGIDLSQRQVADGQETIRQLALRNIELHHQSILDVTPELGQFDYILAHGVYSWVPPRVQDKILDICQHHLTPSGVAYISYNCYPGWHARSAIREMLWYHTEHLPDPGERIRHSREFIAFLAKAVPPQATAYSALILQELSLLLRTPDTYLLHEHLEEFNEPLYFHQFVGRAMDKGLQYLGEAQLGSMVASRFGPDTEKILRGFSPDLLHMEQYMDFLRNRMFRQTLLCHGDIALEHVLRPGALAAFHIASPLKPESKEPSINSNQSENFAAPGHLTLASQDPLMKAVMLILGRAWPRAIPFASLFAQACELAHTGDPAGAKAQNASVNRETIPETLSAPALELARRLLHSYASNLVEFTITPFAGTTSVSERPVASPYARLRALHAEKVTNLRLETVALADASRLVLTHLDGQHGKSALVALVTEFLKQHPPAAANSAAGATASAGAAASPASKTGAAGDANAPFAIDPGQRAALYIDHILPLFAQAALLIA